MARKKRQLSILVSRIQKCLCTTFDNFINFIRHSLLTIYASIPMYIFFPFYLHTTYLCLFICTRAFFLITYFLHMSLCMYASKYVRHLVCKTLSLYSSFCEYLFVCLPLCMYTSLYICLFVCLYVCLCYVCINVPSLYDSCIYAACISLFECHIVCLY